MFTRVIISSRLPHRAAPSAARAFSTGTKIRFNQDMGDERIPAHKIKVYRKLDFNYLANLPYDISGTHSVPVLPERKLVDMF